MWEHVSRKNTDTVTLTLSPLDKEELREFAQKEADRLFGKGMVRTEAVKNIEFKGKHYDFVPFEGPGESGFIHYKGIPVKDGFPNPTYHRGEIRADRFRAEPIRGEMSHTGRDDFRKFDHGKHQMSLLPWPEIREIAQVLEYGAEKYGRDNWRKDCAWNRYIDAMLRHVTAFAEGEDNDPETQYKHLAHAVCCALFLMNHQNRQTGYDDRTKIDGGVKL